MRNPLFGCVLAALLVTTSACGGPDRAPAMRLMEVDPGEVSPAQLRQIVTDPRVKAFYEANGWKPVWTQKLADRFGAALEDAIQHALPKSAFLEPRVMEGDATRREAALTLAAIGYADALSNGLVDPAKLYEIYEHPAPQADLPAGLREALDSGELREWFASLPPSDPEYRALSEAFVALSRKVPEARSEPITDGDPIKPASRDPRLPLIVASLRANGYLASPTQQAEGEAPKQEDPQLYSNEIVEAVKRLQADFGLKADGVIGDDSVDILNAGPVERARTIAVNLERRRWLRRDVPATRIDVNTAATVLDFWRGGDHRHRAVVVVGQPEWETPQLQSDLYAITANPNWTVPKSIAEDEILPKGPAYMARNNMVMKDGWIVQAPGPKSALGLAKFEMDNKHAIYLHDTPAKALFREARRHFSHGCVRVHDAVGFARFLAGEFGTSDAFEKALASGEEVSIRLPQRIPVRLFYHTAYLENGQIVMRLDPYGWDDPVAAALGQAAATARRRLHTHYSDAGP